MPRSRRNKSSIGSVAEGAPKEQRTFTTSRLQPTSVFNDRIENPDAVLQQFGRWEGLAFYERMLRQYPFLVGVCMQWISGINSIDRVFKPGKPGDARSEKMAEQTRYLYRQIEGKETINQKLLWGRYFGLAGVEKVWKRDEATKLLAPIELYDLDPWNFKFGPNHETYVLTANSPDKGELADPRDFMFYRWGSRHTDYGKGDLRYAYMPTWYIQQVLRFGVQAIERFGRPIPWYRYNENKDVDQVAALKAALAAQFKFFVATPTSDTRETMEFPALNVTAAGAAGRAEQEFCRYMEGWCYISLLGTQQTQDKSGGSRALESTRREISQDQTPPGSQALDTVWTKQWSDHIWQVNEPNTPRELWPVCDSDIDDEAVTDGAVLTALSEITSQFRRKEIGPKEFEEFMVRGGIKRQKAIEIAQDEPDIEAPPAPVVPAPFGQPAPDEADSEEMVSIAAEDGTVLRFRKDTPTRTLRGDVLPSDLVNGDEIVTLKRKG